MNRPRLPGSDDYSKNPESAHRLTRCTSYAPQPPLGGFRCSGFASLCFAQPHFARPQTLSFRFGFALMGGQNVMCSHRCVQFLLGHYNQVFPRLPGAESIDIGLIKFLIIFLKPMWFRMQRE